MDTRPAHSVAYRIIFLVWLDRRWRECFFFFLHIPFALLLSRWILSYGRVRKFEIGVCGSHTND